MVGGLDGMFGLGDHERFLVGGAVFPGDLEEERLPLLLRESAEPVELNAHPGRSLPPFCLGGRNRARDHAVDVELPAVGQGDDEAHQFAPRPGALGDDKYSSAADLGRVGAQLGRADADQHFQMGCHARRSPPVSSIHFPIGVSSRGAERSRFGMADRH